MVLRLLQRYGHQPIVLLGGGTTLIGDPSGKDTTRKILEPKIINKNIQSIKKVFNKILDNSNKNTKPIFVNNAEWLTKLNYIQFQTYINLDLKQSSFRMNNKLRQLLTV